MLPRKQQISLLLYKIPEVIWKNKEIHRTLLNASEILLLGRKQSGIKSSVSDYLRGVLALQKLLIKTDTEELCGEKF